MNIFPHFSDEDEKSEFYFSSYSNDQTISMLMNCLVKPFAAHMDRELSEEKE